MRTALVLACLAALTLPARAADKETVVKGNTAFALDLYRKLAAGKDGNLFLSPYSISTALAMTCAGARGDTEKEMAKVLHFDLGQEKLHPAFAELLKDVNGDEKKRPYQLYTANMLWGQKGYNFLAPFLDVTQKHYGAGLIEVDYQGATEAARKTINDWVEKQTKNKIKELLKPGILDTTTRLVLTNAIYFMGNWEYPFDPKHTRTGEFHLAGGDRVKVPLMHQTQNYRYTLGDGVQALELLYKGKRLSMVVLLPEKADGLPALEKQLTSDNVGKWLGGLHEGNIIVTMPKFKMTSEFALKPALSDLGMPTAFSKQADFSGMNGRKNLSISEVVHKAFVDVNELGTEAAAATAVVIADPSRPPPFTVNRPFLFLLRDNDTGSVLFVGRVMNPK